MISGNTRNVPNWRDLIWRCAGLAALGFSGAVMLAFMTSQAAAQVGNQDSQITDFILEEIVVTSRRREELLRDVPISITTFSSIDIERNRLNDLTDYFNKTPNVSYTEAGSRGERDISIRGVSNIGGQVDAIAFYVDEFNIVNGPRGSNTSNTNASVNPRLQDIERIEVLRGPQGTFFGRNATGGAINITTKKPGPEFYGEATAEYGRFDTWSLGAVINVPVVTDKFFVRGSVYYEESDGFVTNANPVGGNSGFEFLNLRGAARLTPNEQLTVDLSVNYTEEEQGLSETIGTGVFAAGSSSENFVINLLGFLGAVDDGLGFYPENQRRLNHDLSDMQRNRFLTVIGRIEWETDLFTITSITGYFDTKHTFDKDLDFTSFGFLKFDNNITSDSFSTELRIASNGEGRIDWLVGGIYAEDELLQLFGVVGGPDIFLGLPDNFPIDLGDLLFQTDSVALFGEATWHVNDRLSLTAGGRYSHDKLFQRIGGVNFGAPDEPGEGQVKFDDFSPRVAATYDVSDQVTLYVVTSKGFKAGGLQLNVTQQLPIVDFDEETIWNFEGGIRYVSADGRMRANLTGFFMDWQDLQVSTNLAIFDENNQISFINTTTNAASATSAGFEFDVRALPTPGLEVGGTIGYLSAEFNSFEDAIVAGDVVDLSGFRIPRAPKWTLSADAEYSFPFVSQTDAFIRIEWSYRSETFPTIESLLEDDVFPFRAPAFDVWNFRIGVENENFRFDAFIENAFNEEYFTTSDGFGFAGIQIHPATRTFGFRLRARTN